MTMENEMCSMKVFEMDGLLNNLPRNFLDSSRRGLSRYYSGKARSFTCLADVHTLEDLKKQDPMAEPKKRKCIDSHQAVQVPPIPCRMISDSPRCAMPCVGV